VEKESKLQIATYDFFDTFFGIKSEKQNIYWSGHEQKPDYASLKQWYSKQLKNPHRKIFKIVYKDEDVGYLYLDILESNIIELSYAVSEKYVGLGIASRAVLDARNYANVEYKGYTIKAYVSNINIPSQKVMYKNSFIKSKKNYMQTLKQDNKEVVMEEYIYNPSKVFIIAEAGVNHNGDIHLAKKLIDVAVKTGADAVKFQTWKTELLVTKEAKQAEYQAKNTEIEESQYNMLKKLELSYDNFRELKEYCDSKNILFLSTPDEATSADFLLELQNIFKIGSGELTNLPFLRHIGSFKKEVILSTGMGTLEEIRNALNVLLEAGTKKENITILHANTQYPTPMKDVNLNAMLTIKKELDIQVGYSDHTLGIEVDIAAVAMGARVIEKHFTLDTTMDGPDHKSSLNPKELEVMVRGIRNIEMALGSAIKEPTPSEKPNIEIVRKSIVASCSIKTGEVLNEDNLTVKRPSTGISPMKWDEVIGTVAKKNYNLDELI